MSSWDVSTVLMTETCGEKEQKELSEPTRGRGPWSPSPSPAAQRAAAAGPSVPCAMPKAAWAAMGGRTRLGWGLEPGRRRLPDPAPSCPGPPGAGAGQSPLAPASPWRQRPRGAPGPASARALRRGTPVRAQPAPLCPARLQRRSARAGFRGRPLPSLGTRGRTAGVED